MTENQAAAYDAVPTKGDRPMARLIRALSTRRCHGCADTSFHTHHLTWIGRRRFT